MCIYTPPPPGSAQQPPPPPHTHCREEGVKGFWKGLSASYWGCSEGCIQFVVYEKLKKQLIERCVAA